MKGKSNFTYSNDKEEYVVPLQKGAWWWWLLLLLLPLLLFIPFKKNIPVRAVNSVETAIPATDVFASYVDYQIFNFKTKKFFTHDTIELYEVTDSLGIAKFENIKYTLYSRLLFMGKKAEISAKNECSYGDSLTRFHKLKNNKIFNLVLRERVYNYYFTVVNKENNQVIPGAKVIAYAKKDGKTVKFEGITEPDGTVYFENFPYCGEFNLTGSAAGYLPDSLSGNAMDLFNNDSLRTLRLTPKTAMIQFFVKDLYSKEPLPGATADLIIDGKVVQTVTTNINGYATSPGEGRFTNVQVSKDFTIHAKKTYYHDTTKSDNLVHWKNLSDDEKTLYLRPEQKSVRFRDTDGRNGLPGVKNIIYVNGKAQSQPVYSNSEGYFMVSGVKATDKISVEASKPGYDPNNYTIKNDLMQNLLNGPQSKRDVPLKRHQQPTPPPPPPPKPTPTPTPTPTPPPPNQKIYPCDSPQESGGQGITTKVHSIGNSHRFTISWDMYNVPDQLIVYCGTGSTKKQIFSTRGAVSGRGSAQLYCKQNYITVRLIGPNDGTQWKYQMNCK